MVTRLRSTEDQNNTGKEALGARHGGPHPPLSVCGRLRPEDDHQFKVHLSCTVSYRLALRYRVNLCPNPKRPKRARHCLFIMHKMLLHVQGPGSAPVQRKRTQRWQWTSRGRSTVRRGQGLRLWLSWQRAYRASTRSRVASLPSRQTDMMEALRQGRQKYCKFKVI